MERVLGTRVIRGPDWPLKNQDGGEGHVGTVVFLGLSKSSEIFVTVQWDSGFNTCHKIGNNGVLRVFDNAQTGVKHLGFVCYTCKAKPITGMRWKCAVCRNYNLCTVCYMSDEHNTRHPFYRIDMVNGVLSNVPRRFGCRKTTVWGIFVGAKVLELHEDANDHCSSKVSTTVEYGQVVEITGWKEKGTRNAVKVVFPKIGLVKLLRLGYGKYVDVKYVEEACGGRYYLEHLPTFEHLCQISVACKLAFKLQELESEESTVVIVDPMPQLCQKEPRLQEESSSNIMKPKSKQKDSIHLVILFPCVNSSSAPENSENRIIVSNSESGQVSCSVCESVPPKIPLLEQNKSEEPNKEATSTFSGSVRSESALTQTEPMTGESDYAVTTSAEQLFRDAKSMGTADTETASCSSSFAQIGKESSENTADSLPTNIEAMSGPSALNYQESESEEDIGVTKSVLHHKEIEPRTCNDSATGKEAKDTISESNSTEGKVLLENKLTGVNMNAVSSLEAKDSASEHENMPIEASNSDGWVVCKEPYGKRNTEDKVVIPEATTIESANVGTAAKAQSITSKDGTMKAESSNSNPESEELVSSDGSQPTTTTTAASAKDRTTLANADDGLSTAGEYSFLNNEVASETTVTKDNCENDVGKNTEQISKSLPPSDAYGLDNVITEVKSIAKSMLPSCEANVTSETIKISHSSDTDTENNSMCPTKAAVEISEDGDNSLSRSALSMNSRTGEELDIINNFSNDENIGKAKISPGDVVMIKNDIELMKRLQVDHGGWTDMMVYILGEVGKVKLIYPDGDLRVQVGEHTWTLNPECVTLIPDTSETQQEREKGTSKGSNSLEDILEKELALMLLQTLNPEKGAEIDGKDALRLACFLGLTDKISSLLEEGHSIDVIDDDGDTLLHCCAMRNQSQALELILLNTTTFIDHLNNSARTALHLAAFGGHTECVKVLLKYGCNVNLQDAVGDTALHDAINKGHDEIIELLIDTPTIDLSVCNNDGFNPLHYAALKESNFATIKIIAKRPDLVNVQKEDGYAALHVAAVNNHLDIARTLITEGKCEVDLPNKRNRTPLALAIKEGYGEMANLLIDAGASLITAVREIPDKSEGLAKLLRELLT